jgi:hypothetical protein
MPKVKGLAFRSVIQAHQAIRGQAAAERVFAQLDAPIAATVRSALASGWYPIANYSALWNAIQQTSDADPDYPRIIGRRCAEQDLRLVHRVVLTSLNTTLMLVITAKLFGTYYDTGTCRCERLDSASVLFKFTDCVGFTKEMWTEVRGSIEVFTELSTKRSVRSAWVNDAAPNGSSAILNVAWQ